jgi:hypothetical protein
LSLQYTGPNDASNYSPALAGGSCTTGYCHLDQAHPIEFGAAYGAGLVDAAAAVG